jgi:hypothetical protein
MSQAKYGADADPGRKTGRSQKWIKLWSRGKSRKTGSKFQSFKCSSSPDERSENEVDWEPGTSELLVL